MAKAFNPSGWINGVTIPKVADFQAIATDLYTLGAPLDAAGYPVANAGAMTLVPGALPGATYTVSAASWAGGVATFTVGGNVIGVNQLVTIAGASPAGYNVAGGSVTGQTSTTITLALASNPGAWVSGGTVTVGTAPGNGTVAVNSSNQVQIYSTSTSSWGAATTAVAAGAWHAGSGVPSSGLGSNSDMYLNLANGNVYGPKTAGAWGAIAMNIEGPTGATGATGAAGSGVGTMFPLVGWPAGSSLAGNTTNYISAFGTAPDEADAQVPLPCAGTFANLVIVTGGVQAGGSLVFTLRRNGGPTPITVTVASGAAEGTFTDLTHTQGCLQLDTWDVQVTNNASGYSAGIRSISVQYS